MILTPEYICIYWHGATIPQWRTDCINQLFALYPEAKKIESYGNVNLHVSEPWRFKQCSENARCLWVDNDIWLDSPLALTEKPALADEYHCGHWSICWSGDVPEIIKGHTPGTIQRLVKSGIVDKIKITGTHWASELDGSKIIRTY